MIPVIQSVTLVAGPAPAAPCSTLVICTAPGQMDFGFYSLQLADGHASFTLDWGDGTIASYTESQTEIVHTYVAAGLHIIRLSNDVKVIRVTGDERPGYAFNRFGELPRDFSSDASALAMLGPYCFGGCTNLTRLDVADSGVADLAEGPLTNCTGLTGELFFPKVNTFTRSRDTPPFGGCTGLRRVHFAAANEAAIKASSPYQADPNLGLTNGTVVFDL